MSMEYTTQVTCPDCGRQYKVVDGELVDAH